MSYPMTPVQSSNVAAVAYDDKTRTQTVRFKDGSTYEYYDVPPNVGNAFPFIDSKGRFIWSNFRGKYAYSKV